MEQTQFLDVLDRDEAERRFHAALSLAPLGPEDVVLEEALGRVLALDVRAPADVPGFTRSNVDGFAVRAADTFGAAEENPRLLILSGETIPTGHAPQVAVTAGHTSPIATGGVLPRGADAVIMVEQTDVGADGTGILVSRPVTPGTALSQAGSDVARGETVLRRGTLLTARETGLLAALGLPRVTVWRRPRVAILSTGDEIVEPGGPLALGQIHDANATLIADAVREIGATPIRLGIVPDDEAAVEAAVRQALATADAVLLSGGTSKGAGDVNANVARRLPAPGVVAHGVALKPGKPLCLAVAGRQPVVVLPGFPASALFTFHDFVAPVLRAWLGLPPLRATTVRAILPRRLNSERGRTEYALVGLVQSAPADPPAAAVAPSSLPRPGAGLPLALPLGRGSGSVSAFAAADGFIVIPRSTEYLDAGEEVEVRLLGRDLTPSDVILSGSHCLGLDVLIDALRAAGWTTRVFTVGSRPGLEAVAAGHADLAGIHLFDPASSTWNRPFLPAGVELLNGYGRMQGLVFRPDDERFASLEVQTPRAPAATGPVVLTATPGGFAAARALLAARPDLAMINRARGSGTRVLIDELLGDSRPEGWPDEAKSHHAVAAAVAQRRADWGIAIANVARLAGLGFAPLRQERFDFAVRADRLARPPVRAFASLLESDSTRAALRAAGFLA